MILALETATTACSAALCAADGSVVAEMVAREGPAHGRRLLPGVHQVLSEAGATWADVGTVAVGLGPGAYTGLRIGVATARALAQADGRVRLAGVPTAAALALALALAGTPGSLGDRLLVPLVDGKRREVFAAVYAAFGDSIRLVEDVALIGAGDLSDWLAHLADVVVGGDGAALYADRLPSSAQVAAGVSEPTAAMVGRAVARGVPGLVWGLDRVLPLYGRTPDAVRWVSPGSPPTDRRR